MYLYNNDHRCVYYTDSVFCLGYLELWLDSNLHLVLFIQYILNTVSVPYTCIIWEVGKSSEWWLIHAEWWLFPTSVDRTLLIILHILDTRNWCTLHIQCTCTLYILYTCTCSPTLGSWYWNHSIYMYMYVIHVLYFLFI